ncbi:2B19 protein, partial [Leiothrix lutea]|nr:2B19 protein [Leiothrix lutea]
FINGTEKVRYVHRNIYNREPLYHFDSDVGHYVGDTPWGEKVARDWNSNPRIMERRRAQVDTFCRHNYDILGPHLRDRRVPPSPSQSLPVHSQ